MYTFLILSSSAIGFYLVLLVALYRDSRKRRHAGNSSVQRMEFGSAVELGEGFSLSSSATVGQNLNWSDGALRVRIARQQLNAESRAVPVDQSKVVYLKKSRTASDHLQIG